MKNNIDFQKEPTFDNMKKSIEDAGGLFYQYRPCRRDESTIYDIENIKHGVVYAQTPLNMNDPFDSVIGYSPDKIYENCISLLVDALTFPDENLKVIITQLLKYKAVGKLAELVILVNDLKKYLYSKQKTMHQSKIPISIFISQNLSTLYTKCPKHIKNIFTKEEFNTFLLIVGTMEKIDITEKSLIDMLNLNDTLEELYDRAVEIRDTIYVPTFKSFLSKMTISCFSASGWDNQLMWSHYANSYSGICIEYDFANIEDFIGFIYPVEYTTNRPTLSLQNLGFKKFNLTSKEIIEYCDVDMNAILSYLLVKTTCWKYEKEWRIINVGEPNTPLFVKLPFIKSITFGINIDPICKHYLWDVCKEKEIDCYDISLNSENFELSRNLLAEDDFVFDLDAEIEYINILCQQIEDSSSKIEKASKPFNEPSENVIDDFSCIRPMLANTIDFISYGYYLKISLNRISDNTDEELSSLEMPEGILGLVSQVNTFISQAKESVGSLQEVAPNLHMRGQINNYDYPVIQKQLFDIYELIEKYEKINWNPIYIR